MTEAQCYLAGYLVDVTWQPREGTEQGLFIASIDGLEQTRSTGETKTEALAALAAILELRDFTN